MPKKFKFELGQPVKEKITGYKGVILARTEHITGCLQYAILSKELKDGKPQDWFWFDEERLEAIGKPIELNPTVGGPHPVCPSR